MNFEIDGDVYSTEDEEASRVLMQAQETCRRTGTHGAGPDVQHLISKAKSMGDVVIQPRQADAV